jgi:hypothetical protein
MRYAAIAAVALIGLVLLTACTGTVREGLNISSSELRACTNDTDCALTGGNLLMRELCDSEPVNQSYLAQYNNFTSNLQQQGKLDCRGEEMLPNSSCDCGIVARPMVRCVEKECTKI